MSAALTETTAPATGKSRRLCTRIQGKPIHSHPENVPYWWEGLKAKSGQVPILEIPTHWILSSPENDHLYGPIDSEDPEIVALAGSIAEHGVQEPLIITQDWYVVSGHRRLAAARRIDLEKVPARVLDFERQSFLLDDDPDGFTQLLRENNRQRVKTFAQTLREQVIDANPEVAYSALIEHRQETSTVEINTIDIQGSMKRAEISAAKEPFLAAIQKVIKELKPFWPLSDRLIHYNLLNNPPLKHASKPDSVYSNDAEGKSYKALTELLTRARVAGTISMKVIADPTRPVVTWDIHQNISGYLQKQMEIFGRNYWRDLMQSQPNHIEIIGEKNTVASTIRPMAMKYCLPMTIGRGYCSLRPRYDIAQRYLKSGKDRLILLMLSDFDPDGEEIAQSFARSMRDDFDIVKIEPVKVALTAGQVSELDLPPACKAKNKSSQYKKFAKKHGTKVWELEAVKPATLQEILTSAIDDVLDVEAFNYEIDGEKEDAAKLEGARQVVIDVLRDYREYTEE